MCEFCDLARKGRRMFSWVVEPTGEEALWYFEAVNIVKERYMYRGDRIIASLPDAENHSLHWLVIRRVGGAEDTSIGVRQIPLFVNIEPAPEYL